MAAKDLLYEPSPRWGQFAGALENNLYVFSGRSVRYTAEKEKLQSTVEVFDLLTEQWSQKTTEGELPPAVYHGACTSAGQDLFTFGGTDGKLYYGDLYHLKPTQNCVLLTKVRSVAKKAGCSIVSFYSKRLVMFGGYGPPPTDIQPGAEFTTNNIIGFTDGRGWTNELHLFDLDTGILSSPQVTGSRPPPCSSVTFTSVSANRAVLFGGYQSGCGRVDDLYMFNFNKKHWTKVNKEVGEPWPEARSHHAACCLDHGGEHPQLLIAGGLRNNISVLKDAWMLDVSTMKWKKLTLPDGDTQPRFYHSITAITLAPGLIEVIMFGGCPEWPKTFKTDNDFPKIAETTILRFESREFPSTNDGPCTREWILVDVANNSQRGTSERLREKYLLMATKAKEMVNRRELDVLSTSHTPSAVDHAESASMRETIQALEEEKTILQQRVDVERRLQTDQPDVHVPRTGEVATNIERPSLSSDSEEPKASAQSSRKDSRIIKVDRQLNIVVYGVPENTIATDNSTLSRQENDLSKVTDLIHSLDESIPVRSIKECYRLGRYQRPHHPRPLLVRLSRKSQVKTVLSKQSQLGGSYYIKPDMSPEELAAERLLLKERWSLIQSGEAEKKDIKINKDCLYINHQLHATVKDSQLVKTQTNNHSTNT